VSSSSRSSRLRAGALRRARKADYRDIADERALRDRGVFVAEGRLVVERVLADPRYRVQSLFLNDAAWRALQSRIELRAKDAPVFIGDAAEFLDITGIDFHRGCLALVERPPRLALDELLATAGTLVVLEGVTDADNVGGIFRNAAAFGAAGVVVSPTCCDPLYRKAIRTSMGASLRIPFARADEWPSALMDLRRAGFTLVALTPREPSEPLDDFVRRSAKAFALQPEKLALVAGTEGAGLSAAVEAAADYHVRIPIAETIDSLNVAMAVGVALYALRSRT
jgi:tRNA G18 (ribose-2'-O)-methylase SpoU